MYVPALKFDFSSFDSSFSHSDPKGDDLRLETANQEQRISELLFRAWKGDNINNIGHYRQIATFIVRDTSIKYLDTVSMAIGRPIGRQ